MLEVHAILQRQRCNENITKKTGTLSDAYEEEEEEDKLFNYNRQSIQNLLITTFNEKWFCNRIT